MLKQSNSAHGLFFMRATVLAAILLGVIAALSSGAGQDKTGLRIAVMNAGKVLSEFKYAQSCTAILEKKDQEAKLALNTWGRYPLLIAAEQDSLVKLVQKEAAPQADMSKAEKDQLAMLKTKHENLVKEYQELLGKPNGQLTPQDSARLEAFGKLKNDTDNRVKAKTTDATVEISKLQDDYNLKIDKEVRDSLTKVAKDKGMNLVFSNQVVLFADNDITDDVISHLNKKPLKGP